MAPGRKSKARRPAPPSRTLVIDNGASTIKAGYVATGDADAQPEAPRIIPNCVARGGDKKTVYVGSELEACPDFGEMAFRRPVEKGFIVHWEAQAEIWEREFIDEGAAQPCDPSETRLLLAEPPGALPILQTNCDQMVFEGFGFASYARVNAPSLNAYHDVQSIFRTPRDPTTETTTAATAVPAEIMLLVDSGYSHTTVTPLLHGRPLHSAVTRLDVGGKLLTNYLTRLLSLRHYDMRNDTHIVNEMKEAACYVSLDFAGDLEKTWKGTRGERRESYRSGAGIAKDYILPDFHTRTKGIVRDYDPAQAPSAKQKAQQQQQQQQLGELPSEDVLTLRNERFSVPELLFSPSDIGLGQPGIPDLILESLHSVPVGLWPGLLANILVVGGNALMEGFVARLQREVVQRVPDDCVVRVARAPDPLSSTWEGGARLARSQKDVGAFCVTKQEYEENGAGWAARRFAAGGGGS